jgi:hypothetical protein
VSLESRVNALEQRAGGGDESGLLVVKVVEVDVDGSETVRKTVYVDPILNCTVPAPGTSEEEREPRPSTRG